MKSWISVVGLLLTVSAIAAAPASAAEWTSGGKPLETEIKVNYEGQVAMGTVTGAIDCPLGFTIGAGPNGSTVVKQFWVTLAGCKTSGVWAKCFIIGGEGLNVAKWKVDLKPPHFDITGVEIKFQADNSCAFFESNRTWNFKLAKVTAAPVTEPFNNVSLSGSGESNFGAAWIFEEFEGSPSNVITEIGEATTLELVE